MGGQQTLEPDVVGRELLRLQAGGFLQGDGRIEAAGEGDVAHNKTGIVRAAPGCDLDIGR